MIIFLAWIGFAAYRSSLMTPPTKPEEFIDDSDILTKASKIVREKFHTGKFGGISIIYVFYFWGVDGLDKTDVNRWDAENMGNIIWDDSFDLSPEAN